MKPTVLCKDIALLFAWGGDNENDERITAPPKPGPPKKATRKAADDDDDDDDEEFIPDAKDRKIRKLSREAARRRTNERTLEEENERLREENENLRDSVNKAVKLQTKYDKLVEDHGKLEGRTREQTIRNAIQNNDELAWYDTSMVLSLLNREELAVDLEDGTVGGLEDQLKKIAKDKPFLLKDAGGSQGNNGSQQRPSGQTPQSSAGGNRNQEIRQSEDKMIEQFPALRNVMK